jgi:integrase
MGSITGHIKLVPRKRGDVWYMKVRPASGRQFEKRIGPAWTERGRPPAGYFTRKTAQLVLDELLAGLRRGEVPDPGARSGKTFGDAVAEWIRYSEHDRGIEGTTLRDYRSAARIFSQEFGADIPIEQVDEDRINDYRTKMLAGEVVAKRGGRAVRDTEKPIGRRTAQKRMVLLGGIFKRAKRLKWVHVDPTADVEPIALKSSGVFNVLTVQQVEDIAAEAPEQFTVAITVAAFTGLRTGELRALRWRDVDFAGAVLHVRSNKPAGVEEKAPKSYKVRSVPLMDLAAGALDRLSRRDSFTGPDDRVFVTEVGGMVGEDVFRDALYEAMEAARVDRQAFPAKGGFVFHDLRHTFGTLAVQVWPISDVQAYMGHGDIQTTMRYAHHVPKTGAAKQFTDAVERLREADELLGKKSPQISPELPKTPRN